MSLKLRNALDVGGALKLGRWLRAHEIEIIHAHVARDYSLAALAMCFAPPVTRLVVTRHVSFALGGWQRLVLRRATRVIAVSSAVAERLRAGRFVPDAKLRIIPNGIDWRRLDGCAHDAEAGVRFRRALPTTAKFLIGIVGELSDVKGQDVFVRAAAIIANAAGGVGADAAFVIVGDDRTVDGRQRARLVELIAAHKLQPHVFLCGQMDDLAPLYAALDVFVSASHAEAFGLALAEALGCGVPAVATATDGAKEIVRNGATGKIVSIGDAEALAHAIIELLIDDDARAQMATRAQLDARARFSVKQMVEATERVYREALGES